MSATTRELFGGAPSTTSATPGSYGEPPQGGYRLPDATRLGPVRLQVADLARSLSFYEHVLGLRVRTRGVGRAVLAPQDDDRTVIELHEVPHAAPNVTPNVAPNVVPDAHGASSAGGGGRHLGLYHYAILLPDRPALGRFARHLAELGVSAGAGDHLVSEALYLADPDGLGIEVYADRPRATWQRLGRELMIATDPVDMPDLMRAAGEVPWTGMPAGTVIGHVHLHVGDLAQSAGYFSDGLGFDQITRRYPGALFLGAGGYHHHLGTNTWAGPAARPPAASDARLLHWTIELPHETDVAAAAANLAVRGYPAERTVDGTVVTHDPWGTQVWVVPLAPATSSAVASSPVVGSRS